MSHFAVLVIGQDGLSLEKQLQPFHEFECTGTNDEYVQDIDVTEEEREGFNNSTLKHVRFADGTIGTRYDDRCYREPTTEEQSKVGHGTGWGHGIAYTSRDWGDGKGYRAKVHQIPDGATEFEEPHPSFASYLRYGHDESFVVPYGQQPDLEDDHKYGYALTDEAGEVVKVVRRTNPNKQWDWWQIGGRWAGFFKLKSGAVGERGRNGLLGSCANEGAGHADSVRKGDIDVQGMRDDAARKAGESWDKVRAVTGDMSDFKTWDEVRAEHPGDIPAARDAYHAQRARVALNESKDRDLAWVELDDYRVTRDEYTQSAAEGALATFAVLKDGQWHERGSMGWWGCVADEKDKDEWRKQFASLIDGLPDDTTLTVVDCHI